MKVRSLIGFAAICTMLIACENEDNQDINVNAPATYEFTRDGVSTISYSGQTARIGMGTELIGAMKDPSTSAEALVEMYRNETAAGGDANPYADTDLNASSKSVKSKVAASSDFFSSNTTDAAVIKADFERWINAQVTEVYPAWNQAAAQGTPGQIADGSSVRYINAKGLEYNQAVNKALIGALMVDQMINNYLSPTVLDAGDNISDNDNGTVADGENYTNMEHKWDEAFGYLFGGSASSSDPLADLGNDSFLNKYLARVNGDEDFGTIAQDVFDALKLGRAAIVAGNYSVRDEQAEIIRGLISDVIGIRAVYYLQQGKLALAKGDTGTAFHDLSEGFGFVYSLRFTRAMDSTTPLFSSTEVDGFISQLQEGDGFWSISGETLDSISDAIAAKFDFTVAQAGS